MLCGKNTSAAAQLRWAAGTATALSRRQLLTLPALLLLLVACRSRLAPPPLSSKSLGQNAEVAATWW